MLHALALFLAAPLLQSEVGPNDFRVSDVIGVPGDNSIVLDQQRTDSVNLLRRVNHPATSNQQA